MKQPAWSLWNAWPSILRPAEHHSVAYLDKSTAPTLPVRTGLTSVLLCLLIFPHRLSPSKLPAHPCFVPFAHVTSCGIKFPLSFPFILPFLPSFPSFLPSSQPKCHLSREHPWMHESSRLSPGCHDFQTCWFLSSAMGCGSTDVNLEDLEVTLEGPSSAWTLPRTLGKMVNMFTEWYVFAKI